jgi:hypothetical protein
MATITKQELENLRMRGSQEDHKQIINALQIDGSLEVVDDPDPPEPEPQLDEEGNELKNQEGDVLYHETPRVPVPPVVEMEIEGEAGDALSEELEDQHREDAERLPATHADLDKLAKERGIDFGDARTIAEKQEKLESS